MARIICAIIFLGIGSFFMDHEEYGLAVFHYILCIYLMAQDLIDCFQQKWIIARTNMQANEIAAKAAKIDYGG